MVSGAEEFICNALAGADRKLLVRTIMSEIPFAVIDTEISTWEGIKTDRESGEQESDYLLRLLNAMEDDVLYNIITDHIPLQRLHQIAWEMQFDKYKPTYKN